MGGRSSSELVLIMIHILVIGVADLGSVVVQTKLVESDAHTSEPEMVSAECEVSAKT